MTTTLQRYEHSFKDGMCRNDAGQWVLFEVVEDLLEEIALLRGVIARREHNTRQLEDANDAGM